MSIIHRPHLIVGKKVFLDPSIYYIKHTFDGEYSLYSQIEKIKRYIFIEMFETRKSRAYAITKILETIPHLSSLKSIAKKVGEFRFFTSEMSWYEYIIYDLVGNFRGSVSLTVYQRIRNETLRKMKKYRRFTFDLSRCLNNSPSVQEFIGMSRVFIEKERREFEDLISPRGSELAFAKHLINTFTGVSKNYKDVKSEEVIVYIHNVLNKAIYKYL